MIVMANVSPNLQTAKEVVKPTCKKRHFRTSFDIQRVNGCETLVESPSQHFYHIFDHSERKLFAKHLLYSKLKS